MGFTELHQWLSWIEYAHQTGRRRSWYQVLTVARRLELLQPASQTVVVAGTNGKGSTVHYTEQLLVARGVKVGSTYSPHLQRYNERIRIDGQEVGDEEIVSAFEEIYDAQGGVHLSYHDYATLASLWIFKQHQVDLAVLEVGVGGRYDATNVVFRDANVITSVALDHQNMLGPDLETIGWEKAGISRCGVPLIYGDVNQVPTVIGRARALHCPTIMRGRDFDYESHDQEELSIAIGSERESQKFWMARAPKNSLSLTLAVQTLFTLGCTVNESDLAKAQSIQLPGRMELIHHEDRQWFLDVAHNPAAITYLMRIMPQFIDKQVAKVLLGVSKYKDFSGIIQALRLPTHSILLTATHGRRGTSWERHCSEFGIQCIEELDLAYQELVANTVSGDLILVVGSFDVVGRLRTKVAS